METLMYVAMALLVGMYLVMAAGVTRLIAASDFFEPRQKLFQYLIVWLIPILGAAFVASILMQHAPRRRSPGFISLLEAIILVAFGASVHDAMSKPELSSGEGGGFTEAGSAQDD